MLTPTATPARVSLGGVLAPAHSMTAAAADAACDQAVCDQQQQQDGAVEPPPARAPSCRMEAAAAAAAAQLAGRRAQAGALCRKLATLQSRSMGANACLLAAPVLFCLVLLVLQHAINHTMSSSEFTCGCQCTQCCYGGNPSNCSVMTNTTCPPAHECLRHNASNCGVQFSVGLQAAFCGVPHPSIWPPITQIPPAAQRAAPARPALTILHTPGINATLSAAATAALLPAPVLQASALLAANAHLASFSADMGGAGDSLPGELASMLGLARLGSATPLAGAVGLYADTAVVGSNKNLDLMVPAGTCRQLGLVRRANTPLSAVLQAMVNASNPPAAAALLNARLQGLTDAAAASVGALAQLTRVAVNCSDVVLAAMSSPARLQRTLYCGNARARCNGTLATNSFSAGIEWGNTSETTFAPLLLFNDSFAIAGEDVGVKYVRAPAPLLNMAVNGFLRAVLGPGASAELVGLGSLPRAPVVAGHNFTAAISSVLGCWVLQLLFPVFVHQLVYEKERRLRLMQKNHGLSDAAYWAVHAAWFAALYFVFAAAFALLGGVTGLNMFTRNDPGIQVVLYVLWGCALIALSFFAACFFTSARTAAVAAFFVVFASGLLGFMLLRYLLDLQAIDARQSSWAVFIEVLPQLALYRGLYELGAYGSLGAYRGSHGMTPANLSDATNGMVHAWIILAGSSVLLALAAWWCEQVFASGTGNRRHPLFFLRGLRARGQARSGRQGIALAAGGLSAAAAVATVSAGALPVTDPRSSRRHRSPRLLSKLAPASWAAGGDAAGGDAAAAGGGSAATTCWTPDGQLVRAQAEPADVAAEAARVAALAGDALAGTPLVIRGLHKVYRARDGQPPKTAVQRLDLAVARGECFGLLGPNGAGKSSVFKMLTGLTRPTAGTATVAGLDVASNMARVCGRMGVCPQHDLLWEALTGREHLLFYGRLKGLAGAALESAVRASLESVSLAGGGVPDKRAGSYSGGMQRRLSVAISFMGDPAVVYLDEPSTGLDPASRRTLWLAIVAAKPGRAIVLTTHSMEEAEVLCDRLGVFVGGRLACIGQPLDITARFCGFLLLTITVAPGQDAAARELVAALCPGATLTYSVGGTLKFELPTSEVSIARVFAAMTATVSPGPQQQQEQPALDILDWSVASASLEDSFIRFSRTWSLLPPAAAR